MPSRTWRKIVEEHTSTCCFTNPTHRQAVIGAEQSLDITFPDDLVSLLRESNGITCDRGLNVVGPIERIVADNLAFRSNKDFRDLYMSFDQLLFFSDSACGDQFAYTITGGAIHRDDVFVWNHETDSRQWVAASLNQFLSKFLDNKISY